jgi:hypothetical protein
MRFSSFVTVAAAVVPALAQHAGHDGAAVGTVAATLSVESAPKATAAWAAPEAPAGTLKAPASYAPISQIGDGQIQAPTATPPSPPAASSPVAPPQAPPAASSPVAPAPPTAVTTPAPAPPAEGSSTLTNTKTKTGTRTLSLSSAVAAPPAPTVSAAPPPAVQTGAAAIMNAASGLSFAAFVAFVLA